MKTPQKKFLLLFNARTGSNLLRSLLNSHPEIVCDEELFGTDHDFDFTQNPYQHIKTRKKIAGVKPVYGYKVSLFQIKKMIPVDSAESFIRYMQRNNWTIIYLNRSNTVLQALSLLKAEKTNIHHLSKSSRRPNFKIPVSLAEAFRTIYSLKYSRRQEEEILKLLPHLNINYEQDLFDAGQQQQTVECICQTLNIPAAEVTTDLVRTSGKKGYEDIVNGYPIFMASRFFSRLITPVVNMHFALNLYFFDSDIERITMPVEASVQAVLPNT